MREIEHGVSAPPTISVIIPVYNTEKYLHRCIDSVLAQTYKDFELLLIDDGSKDSSGAICDEYAAQDTRVRVFHKENGGVSSARKMGVENAKGSWIGFVDSDDEISSSYFKDLYEAAKINGCLLVCASSKDAKISCQDFIRGLLLNRIDWRLPSKLYDRNLLLFSHAFSIPKEVSIGEDLIGNLFISQNVEDVQLVNSTGYHYRENEESITHTRTWSTDYETIFLECVDNALSENREKYKKELYQLYFQSWKNLVYHGAKVDEGVCWIKALKADRENVPTSISSRILLYSPGQKSAYILIKVLSFTKKLFRIRE